MVMLPAARWIRMDGNCGPCSARVSAPGVAGYMPSAAHTYQAEVAPRSSLPGSPPAPVVKDSDITLRTASVAPAGMARVVVGPRHAVLGLVPYVVVGPALAGVDLGEVVVEALDGGRRAAHGVDQAGEVVGDHPGVLGGVALGEGGLARRVERPAP